jgi:hypothetical protein
MRDWFVEVIFPTCALFIIIFVIVFGIWLF